MRTSTGRYRWETADDSAYGDARYQRFNASTLGASATDDYRNEPNCFGWIVEIDPFDPTSTPVKRTALGRFAHEGLVFAPVAEGRALVCYSGDDARNEYIFKFVSAQPYHAATASGDLLDYGTLYVAKFNDDGTGEWLALDASDPAFQAEAATAGVGFASQADVLVNARTAADVVGATKMDRPEWGAIHPQTGEVYFTLTNNSSRSAADAANPRAPSPRGHIIRWRETGNDHAAARFDWDIFVLAGPESESQDLAGNPLTAGNIFNSPDGLCFDDGSTLWIQTDGSDAAPFLNNMMLAADPQSGAIKRFFVGPVQCEVTGVVTTPDRRTMFVNIQHPGEDNNGGSHWPDGGAARPRSATVIVTKDDGGVIGT